MTMLSSLFSTTTSRQQISNTVLGRYLATPKIDRSTYVKECEFLVLDFETTGLNHKTEHLVSMGWVNISNLQITLGSSKHITINPKDKLTEDSVLIHKLTDDELQKGMRISDAMELLLEQMRGKIVVVHFKSIEQNFINEICNRLYAIKKLPIQIIDTLELETKRHNMRILEGRMDALRLNNVRERYHLPRYKGHNAATDALATAELFLAQLSWWDELQNIRLKDALCR